MATVYYDTAAAGAGTGVDWANAFTTIAAAITGAGSGGTIYAASGATETFGTAQTFAWSGTASAPTKLYSVNKAGSVPPVAADLTPGCLLKQNASTINMTSTGSLYAYGLFLENGTGQSTTCSIIFANGGGQSHVIENGKITLASTGTSSRIQINNSTTLALIQGTTCKFGATGQSFNINGGRLLWRDTASAIDAGGSAPTTLVLFGAAGLLQLERLDLSLLTGTIVGAGNVVAGGIWVKDCKNGGQVGQWSTIDGGNGVYARSGGTTNQDNVVINLDGGVFQGQGASVARVGGASLDGTVAYSYNFVATANNNFQHKAKGADIEIYNTLTGAGHTVTMYGISEKATMPTNQDCWLEASCLTDSTSPLKTMVTSAPLPLAAASNNAADTSDWTAGTVAARANSTAYSLGNRIKLASNPGRLFTCTTAGTSAGSEPAGYASAVDGGTVNDGGAVFRGLWRFSMQVTLGTINRAGLIIAWPRLGSSGTEQYWFDPDVVIA